MNHPQQLPTQTVTSPDGTTIAYSCTGAGPAVIIVDAAFSHRAINPTSPKLAALLGPRFRIYTYDRRGRGESSDTQPYAIRREIEDLAALITAAGGRAFVFGGSSGGILALDAAARGVPITKLALYEPPLMVDDSHRPLPEDYQPRLSELVAADRRSDAVALWFTDVLGLPEQAVTGMRSGPFWAELEKVAPTLVYEAQLLADTLRGQPLPPGRWGHITTPTLIVDGGAGEAFMHTGADALAALLANAQRRTLPGQTHDVAADVLAPVLEEFFSDHPAA
jgi:pimeloyl-ACP methyl ester carboxylesterase